MYKKRIRGSRKFTDRMERARAERQSRTLEGPAPPVEFSFRKENHAASPKSRRALPARAR